MSQKEWTSGRLLGVSDGYWESCALHAGIKLDLFSLIGDYDASAEEIAGRIDGNPRGSACFLMRFQLWAFS